jgi:hypothetical protein
VHIGNDALQRTECGQANSGSARPFTKTAGADRRSSFRANPALHLEIGADGFAPDLIAAAEPAEEKPAPRNKTATTPGKTS